MSTRKLWITAITLHLVVGTIASACPTCRYSPNFWGFCGYGAYAGPYDCRTYVADSWTGRTDCNTCGYCNWGAPSENQPCNAGDPNDPLWETPDPLCGASEPSNEIPWPDLKQGLSWVGTPVDQVAIF